MGYSIWRCFSDATRRRYDLNYANVLCICSFSGNKLDYSISNPECDICLIVRLRSTNDSIKHIAYNDNKYAEIITPEQITFPGFELHYIDKYLIDHKIDAFLNSKTPAIFK